MIELKTGVRVVGMSPQIAFAMQVAEGAWADTLEKFNVSPPQPPCVVTEIFALDGHARTSSHYLGNAFDNRTKTLPTTTAKRWFAAEVRRRLGVDYDVFLEGLGTVNEHLHVQYRPKG